jgi:hypothetical protein
MDMNEPIPSFEGRPVEGITVKVSGSAPLEDLNDTVLSIDDRVQLVAVYTVTGVHHQVDKATGNLIRVQTIKPAEMHLLPFNENDPNDDGVIRALPQYTTRVVVEDDDDEQP